MVLGFTFLEIMWEMFIFFAWVIFIIILITVFIDVFKRHDMSGWKKFFWVVFMIFVPFIGVFAYLIVHSGDMAERKMNEQMQAQSEFDQYVKSVATTSPTEELARAKGLLDSGAITQAEYDAIKAKALAS